LSFVLVFALSQVLGTVTPIFTILLVTRVTAALANAGFLAVALSRATALVAPRQKGRALAAAVLSAGVENSGPVWVSVALVAVAASIGLPCTRRRPREGHEHADR
jgi:MFS family permease